MLALMRKYSGERPSLFLFLFISVYSFLHLLIILCSTLHFLLASPFLSLFPASSFFRRLLQQPHQLRCCSYVEQTVYVITRKGDLQSMWEADIREIGCYGCGVWLMEQLQEVCMGRNCRRENDVNGKAPEQDQGRYAPC